MYVIGSNMPGYMPDSDPFECSTFNHARDCIVEELRMRRDDFDTAEHDTGFNAAIEEVQRLKKGEEWTSATIAGYVYWLARS